MPVLFTGTVLGLLGGLLLTLNVGDGTQPLAAPVFGAAAAVTAALHSGVTWGRRQRLRRIACLYPALVLVVGIALCWVTLPNLLALAIGTPAAIASVAVCVWSRADYQLSSDHGA